MLSALLLHGFLLVGFIVIYGRWLDEAAVADVLFVGLIVDLVGGSLLGQYITTLDSTLFMHFEHVGVGLFGGVVDVVFCYDEVSAGFFSILVVALILCLVFLVEYFEYDVGFSSIVTLSACFSQAALLYFCAFDLSSLLFWWECIGMISFMLVQHWAFRVTSYRAGLKVFVVSQLGDVPLFIFCLGWWAQVGTTDLTEGLMFLPILCFNYAVVGGGLWHTLTGLAFCLQAAICLKAAQWFFYPWLLDAMEAPVPISAQLHSSTLVIVGFYLVFRFQILFELTPAARATWLWAGLSTCVGGSILGFLQVDGKKLLACSTASQLGYVTVALGLSLYEEAFLLLVFCCCNKALVFVWLGVFMQRMGGLSDLRVVGGQPQARVTQAMLFLGIANFSVMPGAFCMHVKGLFEQGGLLFGTGPWLIGLTVLQLTWLFSSLYLIRLYLSLFWGSMRHTTDHEQSWHHTATWQGSHTGGLLVCSFVVLLLLVDAVFGSYVLGTTLEHFRFWLGGASSYY